MTSLEDEFKRPGWKEIGLPERPLDIEESAIVLQDEGKTWLMLVNGVGTRLGEREAKKQIEFLTKYLDKFE